MGVKAGRLCFMSGALQLGPVGEVRIGLTFASAIEAAPHDTFLLDLHPDVSADPFDERPYLAAVASLVSPAGLAPRPGVVHVNHTHVVGASRAGEAAIVIALADGEEHALEPAAVDMARSALRSILTSHGAPLTRALGHDEALREARRRVEASYPEAQAERLVVTDEEHMASAGDVVDRSGAGLRRPLRGAPRIRRRDHPDDPHQTDARHRGRGLGRHRRRLSGETDPMRQSSGEASGRPSQAGVTRCLRPVTSARP